MSSVGNSRTASHHGPQETPAFLTKSDTRAQFNQATFGIVRVSEQSKRSMLPAALLLVALAMIVTSAFAYTFMEFGKRQTTKETKAIARPEIPYVSSFDKGLHSKVYSVESKRQVPDTAHAKAPSLTSKPKKEPDPKALSKQPLPVTPTAGIFKANQRELFKTARSQKPLLLADSFEELERDAQHFDKGDWSGKKKRSTSKARPNTHKPRKTPSKVHRPKREPKFVYATVPCSSKKIVSATRDHLKRTAFANIKIGKIFKVKVGKMHKGWHNFTLTFLSTNSRKFTAQGIVETNSCEANSMTIAAE